MNFAQFKRKIWIFYRKNKRNLPWRKTRDPYKILVSEVMLQQTQVSRVVVRYKSFLQKFPTTKVLAHAKLSAVLTEWQGLGYNRRALYLKQCAEKIVSLREMSRRDKSIKSGFPRDFKTLCSLPGIGPATAGDIMAFAWNMPVVVIETNIRSVFLHEFFKDREKVSDKELLPLIEKTLDQKNPREWYWALFDYGAHLKTMSNPSRRSAHHTKQSQFKDSHRQKRAEVLRLLLKKSQTEKSIAKSLTYDISYVKRILSDLQKEKLIQKDKNKFFV